MYDVWLRPNTGKFAKPRSELKSLLEDLGASVDDAVTKKTTALVVGEKSGSKVEKAKTPRLRTGSVSIFLKISVNTI